MEENNKTTPEDLEKRADVCTEKSNTDESNKPSEDFMNYARAWREGAIVNRCYSV